MPEELKNDSRLGALCFSGSLFFAEYLKIITDADFGTVEVRAKRPYRILALGQYETTESILLESVKFCAIKYPRPSDGPCIFTEKAAIYFGKESYFDDKNGHVFIPNQPLSICDKTSLALTMLIMNDNYVSDSTFFYDGGACC